MAKQKIPGTNIKFNYLDDCEIEEKIKEKPDSDLTDILGDRWFENIRPESKFIFTRFSTRDINLLQKQGLTYSYGMDNRGVSWISIFDSKTDILRHYSRDSESEYGYNPNRGICKNQEKKKIAYSEYEYKGGGMIIKENGVVKKRRFKTSKFNYGPSMYS